MATKEEIKSMIDTAVDKVTTAASEAINRATADLTQAINDAKGGAIQIEDVQPAVDKLNTLATTLDNLDIYNPEQPVPPTE